MVQANELRVGNILTDKFGNTLTVFTISSGVVRCHVDNDLEEDMFNVSDLLPILLTAEILKKAGFEDGDKYSCVSGWYTEYYFKTADDIWVQVNIGNENKILISGRTQNDETGDYDIVEINKSFALHTIQNLIWTLTGKELEINL